MTEERIKKLLKERIKYEGLGVFLAIMFIGLIFTIFGGPSMLILFFFIGVCFYINAETKTRKEIKDIDNAVLFLMYPDKEVLIKVMDEIIDHPVFNGGGIRVSEHFILYGEQYENIIRLYDVKGINITKLNDVYSRVDIEDRFGQKKKIKIETPKAEELYNYLSLNCKNAVIGYPVEFIEGDQEGIYIDHDCLFTEEYCFYEGDNKKSKKRETKKDDKKDIKDEIKKEKIKEESKTIELKEEKNTSKKESSNMDQKYNDLKKLKELLDSDIITKEEYDKEKSKILSD